MLLFVTAAVELKKLSKSLCRSQRGAPRIRSAVGCKYITHVHFWECELHLVSLARKVSSVIFAYDGRGGFVYSHQIQQDFNGIARFFQAERAGQLKAITRPPQGIRGSDTRTVAKFHFIKRCKVLEKKSIFQKQQHFSCLNYPFFLRIISKN